MRDLRFYSRGKRSVPHHLLPVRVSSDPKIASGQKWCGMLRLPTAAARRVAPLPDGPLDIVGNNINLIGITVIPFLNLFRELAPLLARRHRNEEISTRLRDDIVNQADDARSRIREISPRELVKFRELPLIVDVREEEEFFNGHIKGAKNVNRWLLEEAVSEIAPDRSIPILVYCAAGNRGALAADSLQKMGYQNVFSLKGGLSGWLEAGGMVETRATA